MKKNLILIGNFNQSKEIADFLQRVLENFELRSVVVVDDGSVDGSDQIARSMGFVVLKHPKNLGIGAAIRTGLQYGLDKGFDGVLVSSSNGKMIPSEFPRLLDHLDQGQVPYIIGSRFAKTGVSDQLPPFRRLMIPLLSFFFSLLFGSRQTDITCGLRAYRLSLLRDPRIDLNQDWLNQYEMEYYLHIKFLRTLKVPFIEVPVTIRYSHLDAKRKSKIRPFVGWWSMARPFVFLFLGLKH